MGGTFVLTATVVVSCRLMMSELVEFWELGDSSSALGGWHSRGSSQVTGAV